MKPRYCLAAILCLDLGGSALDQATDFSVVAETIVATMRANHFHPAGLDDNEAYLRIEQALLDLGETAQSAEEFLEGFNSHWRPGPFSHVGLVRAVEPRGPGRPSSASSGDDEVVTLAWEGTTAILTVDSMTGTDEKVNAAYDEIAAGGAEKLIIDLRRNSGGACAVLPLVGHLIEEPMNAGVFVTNRWYEDHEAPPGPADFASATAARCITETFVDEVLSRALTSYRIDPMEPQFDGPVFVLSSAISVSASEIALDALKSVGRATIVGEKTLGILLQPNRFDIDGGFTLVWPIGDYYSIKNGRIEGVGVTPDIAVDADEALDRARGI